MRKFCTFLLAFGLFSNLFAQNNFWTPVKPESIVLSDGAEQKIKPLKVNTFRLDYSGLTAALANAPMEFTQSARQQPIEMLLPLADGSLHLFRMWESPVMAPEMMAEYPGIRTFAGKDTEGLGLTLRMGLGHKGFHAYFFEPNGQVQALRPYSNANDGVYMAFRQSDLPHTDQANGIHGQCGVTETLTEDLPRVPGAPRISADRGEAEPVQLRKYRLAVTAQGEYTQYHGGTKPLVMSAIVEAVNYLVAIQERDWAVRLELIPNNDTLIYFDPATDPFTGPLIPNWIGDNPGAINSLIGVNSYDIGHLFARVANPSGVYVAGQAALGGVCAQINKAVAGSSLPEPEGPEYYLIIAHEMGHQFSATHTFNSCPPAQDALETSTAYEPGGGSTIMSYATTCSPDIVDDRDAYFHVANLEQVMNFISNDLGSTCPVVIPTTNRPPVVDIPLEDYFYIPISTPFELTGVATDEDGDNLSYCWEEFDLGPTIGLGQAFESSPLFRSYLPNNSPTRTFPSFNTLLNNVSDPAELLPTYGRELRFKLTVRDNAVGAGGVGIDLVRFRSAASAGPFRISFPNNASVNWYVGEYQTVTWDVANTNLSPVLCQKVNIRLSVDGGFTYPIVLAEGQPNIGRACIVVPNNVSTTARVRVEAADNVFFDISNANFKIQQASTGGFTLCPATLKAFACLPEAFTTEISTSALAGFSDLVTLSTTGLPNGATATFSPNPVVAGQNSTLSISIPNNTAESTFDVTVTGTSGAISLSSFITLTSVNNDFSSFAPISPANGAAGVNPNPLLQWSAAADANAYDVELGTSPSFAPNTLIQTKSNWVVNSFQITTQLNEGGVYFWRVRAKNDCGGAVWSAPQAFVVSVLNCVELAANDLPKNISPNGTPTIESKITLPSGGQISDVDVTKVAGFHDYFKDLDVRLLSPAGTEVVLWKDRCGSFNGTFDISFNDGAASTFSCPPPTTGSEAKPAGQFSTLNGQDASGVWTLRVKDNAVSSGGSISAFSLKICSNETTNPPLIVVNNVLQPVSGNNAGIGTGFLQAQDANNTPAQLIFTLMSVPQKGLLELYSNVLEVGSQFTQADIDNGGLRYFDYGLNAGGDEFQFVVADGEGGMALGIFQISALVGTKDLLSGLAFTLSPNPADAVLRLSLNESLVSDALVSMYNAAGQRVRTWSLAAGSASLSLQIGDLPEGVYAVSIENEAVRGVRKVVVR